MKPFSKSERVFGKVVQKLDFEAVLDVLNEIKKSENNFENKVQKLELEVILGVLKDIKELKRILKTRFKNWIWKQS